MMRALRPTILERSVRLLALLAVSACASDSDAERETPLAPMPPTLLGAYSGEFPCGNCAAIDAALWLRHDGRFILRQRYIDDPDAANAPSASFALGRWTWDGVDSAVILSGTGPRRRLMTRETDRLELVTASPIAHMLARDDGLPPLAEGMPLVGVARVEATTATFRDCVSQLELDVAAEAGFAELRRQHRAFRLRGRPALTSVAGYPRAIDGGREVWILERVVSVNPDKTC